MSAIRSSRIIKIFSHRRFKEILASERLVLNIIKDELAGYRDQFGDQRYTEIVEETKEITIEDMIVEEDMVVTISKQRLYQAQSHHSLQKPAPGR